MARSSSSKGVLTAVGVVLAAAVLRAALHPWISDAVPFITFFAAVAAASWYGGLWSGITAIVLSCVLADWFFIPPFYTLSLLHLDPPAWSELAVFSAMSGVIVGLSESMHSAKAAAQSQALRAEEDAYGAVIGASRIDRDATERKHVEASLALLARTSDTLAALVDPQSVFQQAVWAMTPFFCDWCAVYGLNHEGDFRPEASAHRNEGLKDRLAEALESGSVDRITPLISVEALRSGRTQMALDAAAIAAAGGTLPSELRPRCVLSVPLRNRERVVGALTFAVTELNRCYTPHDAPFAEDLARRVGTALDNAQLLKLLKTADRQKDEFLAMLAHELRNPLAAIRYALELVRMPQVGPRDELLDMVDRQCGNLVRMIDGLLDVSRISRGKIELHREPADAGVLVRNAAETVQPLIKEKNQTLVLEAAEEPLTIDADATRVEQIVGNLLTNAAKYTPAEGRIDLWVRCEDGQAVIEVKDTGIGIAPDILPHVFELFAQADKTLDRSQGGLGIGLTVVQKLTELHGGTVAAASDGPGRGAKFTVRFPLVATAATAPEDGGDNRDGGSSTAQRILIVEDNLDTARAEALLLQAHGHIVEVIHNGREAVELACRFRPHAMLIDIGLPGLSGYEVASALRQQGLEDVKLIAVSGYGQAEDRARSLAAGFDHHLVKPVASEALFSLLSSGCSPVSASSQRSKKSGTP